MTAEQELAVEAGFLLAVAYTVGTWWILTGEPHCRRRRIWCFAGMLAVAGAVAALAHEFLDSWGPSFAMVCCLSAVARDHLKRRGIL